MTEASLTAPSVCVCGRMCMYVYHDDYRQVRLYGKHGGQ